jgi:hypothetical protein
MAVKKINSVTHKYKKNTKGDIIVEHPKGKGGSINVTKQSGAKTKKAAVKASVKYHKSKPHTTKKGK